MQAPTETIVQISKNRAGGWKATHTTADCSRWIADRGTYPTLAAAVRALRHLHQQGQQFHVSATQAEVAEALAELKAEREVTAR